MSLTLKNKIFQFNDFLPLWLVEAGNDQFRRFPFEFNHHVYEGNKNPFFGKMLYNKNMGVNIQGPYIVECLIDVFRKKLLYKMDPKAEYLDLERIIVNGQTPNQTPDAHVDYDIDNNIWTMVYYVNNSDGGTLFFDEQKNLILTSEFKQGKAVIFQSNILHQAEQTTSDWRVSIGINFRISSELNS